MTSRTVTPPRRTAAPPASPSSPAGPLDRAPAPPVWQEWGGLWIIYIVWGSTYLAIRIMVETVPPLLAAGARFFLAGVLLLGVLSVLRRGLGAVTITWRQAGFALLLGILLPGANAVVTVAEQEVPSALAALLIASVPLWVLVFRGATGERISRASWGAVAVGFAGVALLMVPGEQTAGASLIALLGMVLAAAMWGYGSFIAPKLTLPKDLLVSTGWQMLLGGLAISLSGVALGELADVDPSTWSTDSVLAWVYLVLIGSLIAFTAYVWLLQHVPVSKVATYAYVNPVVAIILGYLVLDEAITPLTLVGAAIIVVSVALVIRVESARRVPHQGSDP